MSLLFSDKAKTSVITLRGAIVSETNGSDNITFSKVVELFNKVPNKTNFIILRLSSPGGDPHASFSIASYIRNFCDQKNITLITYVENMAASGGYYIASVSDKIVGNKFSIFGSIGVIGSMFDFTDFMEKYGIGYRVFTIGENKAGASPFTKLTPNQEQEIKNLQKNIYDEFVNDVIKNRGNRLKITEQNKSEIFSGKVYVGKEAIENGLVDELHDTFYDFMNYYSNIKDSEINYINTKKKFKLSNYISSIVSTSIEKTISNFINNNTYKFK